MVTTNAVAEPKVPNQDEINKILILLKEMKWEGEDAKNLIGAVYRVLIVDVADEAASLLLKEEPTNEEQIEFAKYVYDEIKKPAAKKLMAVQDTKNFLTLCADQAMSPLLTAALDRFMNGTSSSTKATDYLSIVAKYDALKTKLAAEGPFTEQLTKRELAFMEKFEAKEAENQGKVLEHHKPNENAVTYVYLLGRIMYLMSMQDETQEAAFKITSDVLQFFAVHGQTTFKHFEDVFDKYKVIEGPTSKIDIAPKIEQLTTHDWFVKNDSASVTNKFTKNYLITLKRIVRIVHICTKFKTPWGLMRLTPGSNAEFIKHIKRMYELESQINSVDMISLSIIWYMIIGRMNMVAVTVDRFDLSANNAIATLLGKTAMIKEQLEAPSYTFPNKPPNKFYPDPPSAAPEQH